MFVKSRWQLLKYIILPPQVREVDQQRVDVEQFKLRGAVAAEAHAGIGGYEGQDEVDVVLVSDADKEEGKDKNDELLEDVKTSTEQAMVRGYHLPSFCSAIYVC